MSAGALIYPGTGGVNPPLDGKTPVFEEVGADPTSGAGLDRPPLSGAKFSTVYYWKYGSGATQWSSLPFALVGALGVSTLGNTAGSTGMITAGSLVLAGVSGVSLSQSTGAGGGTISIIASAENGVAFAAGTQTALTGTAVLSASNGLTFGMSNSSIVTASHDGLRSILAGGDTFSATSVSLGNSNGVSFGGLTIFSRITASHDGIRAISAPSGSVLATGTLAFANIGGAGGVNFSTGAGPFISATVPCNVISAGTQLASTGTVVLSNSQIEFGLSGSSQLTAQIKPVSMMVNNGFDRGVFLGDITAIVNSCVVAPWYVYAPINATRVDQLLAVSNGSSGGGTVSMLLGFYTLTGSTANLAVQMARAWQYNSTLGSNSSYTQISGTRYRSMTGPGALTAGQYLVGAIYKITTGQTSGTYQPFGGRDVSVVANEYPNALGTNGSLWNGGMYSVSTTALPASFHLTDIVSTGINDIAYVPFMTMYGTF